MIVRKAWEKSFAKVQSNKKAIAARGWNPLTRNLLDHPEIWATMTVGDKELDGVAAPSNEETAAASAGQISSSSSGIINVTTGYAGEKISDLFQHIDRNAIRQTILQRQQMGDEANQVLQNTRKHLTAGALFKAGKVHLGMDVMTHCQQRKASQEEEASRLLEKRLGIARKKREAVLAIRSLNKDENDWDLQQLKTMVSYKTQKGDLPMPKKKEELLQRWRNISHRLTPPPSPERERRVLIENQENQENEVLTSDIENEDIAAAE